jgi:hypothetical protein
VARLRRVFFVVGAGGSLGWVSAGGQTYSG